MTSAPSHTNGRTAARLELPMWPAAPVPELSADQVLESVSALREDIRDGLLYTHHRANTNTSKTLEVTAFSYALIELLVERGILTVEELDERKRQVAARLAVKFRDDGMGVVRQEPEVDKYTFEQAVTIDCASRLSLCRAACCRLQFALSRQDVEEGVVQWEFARPYLIRRKANGSCFHLDDATAGCAVYAQRPLPCRGYDCRQDGRIWSDFEGRVVSPDLARLFPDDGPDQPPASETQPPEPRGAHRP